MKRKAQMQHVFIYIMVMVVVGGILLVGYGFVKDLLSKGCEAELFSFKTDLQKMTNTYNSHGSMNIESLNLPCEYTELCFVDRDSIGSRGFNSPHSYIETSVQSGVDMNIFLVGPSVEPLLFAQKVKLENMESDLCFKAKTGIVKVKFEGKGRTIKVTGV
ncbi:hypothetical protein CMO92_02955 [Candidatus Woesearchaeota archaeon]|nr:hypothetical protein [Candidatus Woesearchaeota archaeon]